MLLELGHCKDSIVININISFLLEKHAQTHCYSFIRYDNFVDLIFHNLWAKANCRNYANISQNLSRFTANKYHFSLSVPSECCRSCVYPRNHIQNHVPLFTSQKGDANFASFSCFTILHSII